MGTPEFAVVPLQKLIENGYRISAVVTAPDKKAGRGQKVSQSPVKQFAIKQDLSVLQPEKLKSPEFNDALRKIAPDLMIVVAFRMLPEMVWALPKLGTFNLHASLLPQYRGAAPINWALINGEKETGVTTFFLDKEIDTGKIILQEEVPVSVADNVESLHNKLMVTGADLVLETVEKIRQGKIEPVLQDEFKIIGLKKAPKIFKPDCRIEWTTTGERIFNFIRGLSPFPGAWTQIKIGKEVLELKIFSGRFLLQSHSEKVGTVICEKEVLKVAVTGGFYQVDELQLQNKKRMTARAFLNGFGRQPMKTLDSQTLKTH
ncbi:MAG: methionyl-tRNA formyltransferase [Bacteroidales bacterium]|nr:methionyl-tRNA formyltransferase [Bacteroidales bacterium]